MLNFDEELKKFKPSLEVGDIEQAVYQDDLADVTEIIKDVIIDQSTGQLPNMAELEAAQKGQDVQGDAPQDDAPEEAPKKSAPGPNGRKKKKS